MSLGSRLQVILAVALFTVAAAEGARAQTPADDYELRPEIRPADVLPEEAVSTDAYRVLDEVLVNGNWLEFRIDSEFGNIETPSLAMLSTRIAEIRILADALDGYRRTDPALADRLQDQFVRAGVFFVPSLAATENEESVYATLEPEKPVIAAHKRRIASRLGLDVYSTNPLVQHLLDTLVDTRTKRPPVRSAVAVPLPVSATGAAPSPEALDRTVDAALARFGIARLTERNRERLESLGIEADLIEAFLRHRMLSPRHKTVITEHLAALDGVQDRNSLLVTAVSSTTEHEAAAYARVARILTLYHRHVSPLTRLVSAGHIVLATTGAMGIVVVLPFDVVYWNAEARRIFTGFARYAAERQFRHWSVITDGIVTDTARTRLLELKFDLIPRFLERLSPERATQVASGDASPAGSRKTAPDSTSNTRTALRGDTGTTASGDTGTAAPPEASPVRFSSAGEAAEWIRGQPPDNYTIQVLATKDLDALTEFVDKNRFADTVGWFRFQRDGDTWFALLHGSYESRGAAKASVTTLPQRVRKAGVWIRRFSDVHANLDRP